ncbi:MAG: hypothetical protein [Circular genetic element sp.]|nr:MAG: hypothetical protein [Circular genetic element sp.]
MSDLDFTLERAHSLIQGTEQLTLALMMLYDQDIPEGVLRPLTFDLLERINNDLQDASMVILVNVNQAQGGMGEAPMLSAS